MHIMRFLAYHRERVDQGIIASGTLKQYWQAIRKLTDAFMDLWLSIYVGRDKKKRWMRVAEEETTAQAI